MHIATLATGVSRPLKLLKREAIYKLSEAAFHSAADKMPCTAFPSGSGVLGANRDVVRIPEDLCNMSTRISPANPDSRDFTLSAIEYSRNLLHFGGLPRTRPDECDAWRAEIGS